MSSSPAVTREAQLEWEARTGRLAAVAAFLAAATAAGSTAIQFSIGGSSREMKNEFLTRFDAHRSEFFLSFGFQILSYFLLAGALSYLLRATTYRRPETPKWSIGLVVLAPVLLAVGGIVSQIDLGHAADEFLATGARTPERAKALLKEQSLVGGALGEGGILALAIALVSASINAMRAGLLSRFMGVLGSIVGGLLVIPLLPGGVVQLFWLAALGALFLGRWPGGRGPAWESGEAVPWPSAAEVRSRQSGEAEEPEPEPEPEGEAETPPHPVSRKRKKKRR